MGKLGIFFLRLILSIILAAVVVYFFFDASSAMRVGGLALGFLGFAYLFEYTKKRDKGGDDGN